MENQEKVELPADKSWFLQHKLLSAIGIIILAVVFLGWLGKSTQPEVTPQQQKEAVEDWKKLVEAAAREGIIMDVKNVATASLEILVGDGWYALPYETKVKTLETLSLTHRKATGNFLLKARDFTTGRIVGEVTAFSNVKIY